MHSLPALASWQSFLKWLSYSGIPATFMDMRARDQFLEHVRPLQRQLTAYARRLLRDPNLVEDALQSTLCTAFGKFNVYVEGTNFRAWIFQILTFEIFNLNRKHEPINLSELPLESMEELESALEQELSYADFLACSDALVDRMDSMFVLALSSLTALERSVLLMRTIPEFSYKEIAQILEIPVGSVMGYLSRARRKMRSELMQHAHDQGWLKRRNSHEMQ